MTASVLRQRRSRRRHRSSLEALARQRLELFADVYGNASVYPANTLLNAEGEHVVPERAHFIETQRKAIEALVERGVI